MSKNKFKKYIIDIIKLLKKQAKEVKEDADNPKEGFEDYTQGVIMGYYSIITLLKHQAFAFCIDQKEFGLADIKPERDLLDLHRNPEMDFEEDNWTNEVLDEEKAKGYLFDSISLLKEQAREAKIDASNLREGNNSYNEGHLMAYHKVIEFMKNQTEVFNINQEEIGLADIEPDRDLL